MLKEACLQTGEKISRKSNWRKMYSEFKESKKV
jgi:hypothetical protein